MNIIPISTIVKTDIEILGSIVSRLEEEHSSITSKINEVDQIYRAKSPDIIPHIQDLYNKIDPSTQQQEKPKPKKSSKAVKKLFQRLAKLTHPDKVADNLRERMRELFERGVEACTNNNSAVLKLLLD